MSDNKETLSKESKEAKQSPSSGAFGTFFQDTGEELRQEGRTWLKWAAGLAICGAVLGGVFGAWHFGLIGFAVGALVVP